MHGTLPIGSAAATIPDGKFAAEKTDHGKSAVDDSNWFSRAARRLLPHKAGTWLHLTTKLGDERLCQRYASGEVKPPAYFFRALLRDESGDTWLAAAMEGSTAKWWLDYQRAKRIAAALDLVER